MLNNMEEYIENKLFTNLRQRLKRKNPKFEVIAQKIKKEKMLRPNTSRSKLERVRKRKEKLILMESAPCLVKSKNRIRNQTATTRTQTPSYAFGRPVK
jgi:hypothetical protein